MSLADFDIDGDGLDQGADVLNSATVTFSLRQSPPIGVRTVVYQVFDPGGFVPASPISLNPPRSSPGAPTLTLVGATSGQSVSPAVPDGNVTCAMPGAGAYSWIVRCTVNGGMDVNGRPDASLIRERMISIRDANGLRRVIATETTQYSDDGWVDALNEATDSFSGVATGAGEPFVWSIAGGVIDPVVPGTFDSPRQLGTNRTLASVTLLRNTPGAAGDTVVDVLAGPAGGPLVSVFGANPKPTVNFADAVAESTKLVFATSSFVAGTIFVAQLYDAETYDEDTDGPEGITVIARFT